MDPLFAIILPTHNRAYVVWRAIQSVLAQTEGRWELLVIDDGSTDQTPRVLEEFRDPRIRSFATPNRGPAARRIRRRVAGGRRGPAVRKQGGYRSLAR